MTRKSPPAVPADLTDETSLKRFLLDLVSTQEQQATQIDALASKVEVQSKQIAALQAKH